MSGIGDGDGPSPGDAIACNLTSRHFQCPKDAIPWGLLYYDIL